jgi:hypothetical protein
MITKNLRVVKGWNQRRERGGQLDVAAAHHAM